MEIKEPVILVVDDDKDIVELSQSCLKWRAIR